MKLMIQFLLESPAVRRGIFFSLVAITTLFALGLLTIVFQQDGITLLELILLILYGILFTWICLPFWTAVVGFVLQLCQRDPFAITIIDAQTDLTEVKTAMIMPIHNEEACRVFAGLRAIIEDVLKTEQSFDFYILSDTTNPDIWVEEEMGWYQLQQEFQGKIAVYYRHRENNSERKVGNIKDFCTRWGGHYRYMIVLDADSVMTGTTLVKMVTIMEQHPQVALLQVPPVPAHKESLFARIQQFAGSVYGRIFTAGLNFWQLGEGNYWGHNAIIRIEPFVRHCGLPKLPGREPLGGEILSHDFIEAALLRRAGWQVWLGYDLGGSYEEIPPTLIDYAKRDRRWCQGNLQHIRLLFTRGFHPLNRLHLLMGIMSYLASPLWLLFLLVTGVDAYVRAQMEPVYFFGETLFPIWPISYTVEMTTVLVVTLTILFLPKILGLSLLFFQPDRVKYYGGRFKVSLSVLLETIFSMLIAPIMMLFQTKFVIAILLRRNIEWATQQRDEHHTGWKEALFSHSGQTVLGITAGIASYFYVNAFFWWFIPVLVGLVFSIPLSMVLSHVSLGQRLRQQGLFLIPEETNPPSILIALQHYLQQSGETTKVNSRYPSRFLQVIFEPGILALHTLLLPAAVRDRRYQHYLQGLIYQMLEEGVESLNTTEKQALLSDRTTLLELHTIGWTKQLQI
ncbi:MAG: glucan biosynthesis glucosyltransferase H [Beggiatoa sp. IS2]|nr:MAG: glucan biosynthesis glucosyltransferase H [Beggiatoa sp. IS2]